MVEVTPDALVEAASLARSTLEPFTNEDWTVPAGELASDIRTTVTHTTDAVGWYAAHLAAASPVRLDFRAHGGASNSEVLDVLDAAAAGSSPTTAASATGTCC